jgi:hypothetical protein
MQIIRLLEGGLPLRIHRAAEDGQEIGTNHAIMLAMLGSGGIPAGRIEVRSWNPPYVRH